MPILEVAVLGGAGAMGRAVVFDLARQRRHVRLIDADGARARAVARRYGARRTQVVVASATHPRALAASLGGAGVLVHCGPYRLNLAAMEAALLAGCHYLDLGGLFHTTRRQLAKDPDFRRAGLLAVLGMGSAPGIVNVLARAAADSLRRVRAIRIYNGGADYTRYASPLSFSFSPATVLDEMTLEPVVFSGGRFRAVPPLSGAERFPFEQGTQVVRLSLHSEVATLPRTYGRRGLRECTFKIAYDPEQFERLKLLVGLGLADREPGPRGVAPRDVLLDRLRRSPPAPDEVDDRDFLAVVIEGKDAGGPVTLRCDLIARPQRRPPLSAVARDTGFPAAIVARMIIDGTIAERGVLPPERCVPVAPFLAALAQRGLRARMRRTRPRTGER